MRKAFPERKTNSFYFNWSIETVVDLLYDQLSDLGAVNVDIEGCTYYSYGKEDS